MVWKKVDRAASELPASLVTVTGSTSPKLHFSARAVKKIDIGKYHSADIYIDDKSPFLMALQLYQNGDGAFKIGHRPGFAVISASRALRQAGAKPSCHYHWRRDAEGFIVVDFSRPVSRGDWERMRLKRNYDKERSNA